MSDNLKVRISLPREIARQVERLRKQTGENRSEIVRRALALLLAQAERPVETPSRVAPQERQRITEKAAKSLGLEAVPKQGEPGYEGVSLKARELAEDVQAWREHVARSRAEREAHAPEWQAAREAAEKAAAGKERGVKAAATKAMNRVQEERKTLLAREKVATEELLKAERAAGLAE